MNFVPLKAEHVLALEKVVAVHTGTAITPELAVDLEQIGGTTALHDGEVLGIAGIMPRWEGTGLAWAWLDRKWRGHARAITEEIRRVLAASPLHRIEVAVRCDFPAGHRWARKLGFELETPRARMWGPDKVDYSIFVRLKHG